MLQKIKGTQDWLNLTLFNFILDAAKKHLQLYQYHQIKTPILEPTDLFKRSLGVTTDVVSKEMFIIKSSKEDDAICLRPEATAPTVRAFLEGGISHVPWKVFSWGSMFRHERPQKGRYREFHQITIENIGAASISNDVELITMLDRFFHETCKLQNYALKINFLGSYDDRNAYNKALLSFLQQHADAICATCVTRMETNVMRTLDCKNPACQEIYTQAPIILDHLSAESKREWQTLQQQLELLSVSFAIDPRLVRGLDYYNKTVFEFVSPDLGAQNTFCGGGRYDGLVHMLDGKQSQPACGAAIGIERLLLLLEPIQEQLALPTEPALTVIVPLSEQQTMVALLLADELRAQHKCAEVLLDGGSMKSLLRRANKLGATYVALIGEDEQQKHEVTLKHMHKGTQDRIKQAELIKHIA